MSMMIGFDQMSLSGSRSGGGGTPTPTPSPILTKVLFDGDSNIAQSAGAWSFAERWRSENPGIPSTNIASAGASIRASENATNNLVGRIPDIVTYNPSDVVIHIGTNDLTHVDAATYLTYLFDYVAQVKAAVPGVRVHCTSVIPSSNATRNARRVTAEAGLRAAVGTQVDSIIPLGSHPLIGQDSVAVAGSTEYFYTEPDLVTVLHLATKGHTYAYYVLSDVLNPLVAGSAATSPTLPLFNVENAPLSTDVYSRGRVSGMRNGTSAAVSMTGVGDFRIGTASAGSSGSVFNGDVITSRLPTSGSNAAGVSQTVTAGSTVVPITATTRPASYPTSTMTMDPAAKSANVALQGGNLQSYETGGSNAFQIVRSNAQPLADLFYFEVTAPSSATNYAAAVFDSTVPLSAILPGYPGTYANDGFMMAFSSPIVVYSNGVVRTSYEGINFPNSSASGVYGVAMERSTGRFWLRDSTGWFHGDPVMREGGFQLPAPLAQHWAAGLPKTANVGTVNYGGSAFTYTLPTGFWGAALYPDTTDPVLSSPTDAANGSTGGSLSVSTTEGNGTLYWYVSTSATVPGATLPDRIANLKAGTGSVSFGNQAVTTTGVQNVNATGLTASTPYYAHFVHTDSSSNDSNVASGDGFTTAAGVVDFVNDTFTEASNTALTAHTPNTGGAWSFATAGTATVSGANDNVFGDSATSCFAINAATPPSANYSVFANIARVNTSDDYVGLLGRFTDINNYIAAYYGGGSGWIFQQVVAGVVTSWATTDNVTPFTLSTAHAFELRLNGTAVSVYLNGVLLASGTTTVAAAGKAGFRTRNNGRVDDFRAAQ